MKYVILLCLLLTGCKDECVENGGKWVVSGYVPTWQTISGISTMVMNPIHDCVHLKKAQEK
jgi:hypothetical protein